MSYNLPDHLSDEAKALVSIFVLQAGLEEQIDSINVDPPLSKNERRIVGFLGHPKRMGDLAKDLHVLPSTITATVAALEKMKILTRGPDPSDRRATLVELTPFGLDLQKRLIAMASRVFEHMTGLDRTEIATLSRLLDKAQRHMTRDGIPEGIKL